MNFRHLLGCDTIAPFMLYMGESFLPHCTAKINVIAVKAKDDAII